VTYQSAVFLKGSETPNVRDWEVLSIFLWIPILGPEHTAELKFQDQNTDTPWIENVSLTILKGP